MLKWLFVSKEFQFIGFLGFLGFLVGDFAAARKDAAQRRFFVPGAAAQHAAQAQHKENGHRREEDDVEKLDTAAIAHVLIARS